VERLFPLSIVVVFMTILAGTALLFLRWVRGSKRRRELAAWGIHLIGAGMNQQPTTQEQIEQVARQTKIKRTSESGDPKN
jgi:hypothetical protein